MFLGLNESIVLYSISMQVIPDSVTTLTQYLSHLRRDFEGIGWFSCLLH